ncbi:MAG: hypothetical protein B6I35_03825 [Anaerolineaceae bacterium 4572_32.2]|nr:MAG: hypothetical protein B6I35_03825 [Anaerolineaceae bacterium 4572_32.2]
MRDRGIGWLGWAVAQANQDTTHGDGGEAKADPYALQRSKSPPLTSADKVHSDGSGEHEQAERDDDESELAFGYHCCTL